MKEDDSEDWKKIGSVGSFDQSYTAKNLKTDKPYKFAVSAENKIGQGQLAELETPVTLHKKPGMYYYGICLMDIFTLSCKY